MAGTSTYTDADEATQQKEKGSLNKQMCQRLVLFQLLSVPREQQATQP